MSVRMTGDWQGATRAIAKMDIKNFQKIIIRALEKLLVFYVGEIKKNIISGGSHAGVPFVENSEITIKIKGSSAPLIDTGDMLNGINYFINGLLGFVGLKRGDVHTSGEQLVDIGEVHEFGAVVTTKTGKQVLIPKRAFIGPVRKNRDILDKGKELFVKEIKKGLKL